MKKHPLEKANILSLLTFGYTLSIFKKGYQKELEQDDIPAVLKSCSSKKCGDIMEKRWGKTPSLMKVLIYQFGTQYILISLIEILWAVASSVLSPLGLSKVVAYFTPNQNTVSRNEVYEYAGILVFLTIFDFVLLSNLNVWEKLVGIRIQVALRSFLYRKFLKLSPAAAGFSVGNIITLISKDIKVLEDNIWTFRDFVLFFIKFGTAAYLLYKKIGYPAFIGIGFVVSAVSLQVYLSCKLKNLRLVVSENSVERLQRMQETLSAMKIIKMYTWETIFCEKISKARRKEVKALSKLLVIGTLIDAVGTLSSKIAFLLLITVYISLGYTTNIELIFYVLQIFSQLSRIFGTLLSKNFSKTAQFHAAVIRFNNVLHGEEVKKFDNELDEKPNILLEDVTFELGGNVILDGVSLNLSNSGLIVVTGRVGSGKSSLLKVITREYQTLVKGHVDVIGRLSYASQEPWIFPATVRENILFGERYEKSRYDEVIRVCALEQDFSFFDEGDQTILTDRGQNFSKGQQARINLARAVYRKANIYLLDEPLSALDVQVQNFVFNECILGFLKDKIVILVSQSYRSICKANKIIVLNNGKIVSQEYFNNSTDLLSAKIEDFVDENENEKAYMDVTKDNPTEHEQPRKQKAIYKEFNQKGSVKMKIYSEYFRYGGGFFVFLLIMGVYVVSQFCESYGEKQLTRWADYQQKVLDLGNMDSLNDTDYNKAVYDRDYTSAEVGILIVLRSIFHVTKNFFVIWFCRNASIKLHKKMTLAIVGAHMAFFDAHFVGNILNRMSFDINCIDEYISAIFTSIANGLFQAGGTVVLIATVNWIFLIPMTVFAVTLVLLRNAVMPSLRSLQRLTASSRSPLIGHTNSSLEGLATVRALNAELNMQNDFDKHQDLYTSAIITMRLAKLGFTFYIEFMGALFSCIVIGRFLFFEHSSSAGDVGLALTQVTELAAYVKTTISKWSKIETQMISVERCIEYTGMEQETNDGKADENWPSKGGLWFKKVTLFYDGCKVPVLKQISFEVQPREKIGIVGRTGAGKSSLITVLYRLYEYGGIVEIDGINTKQLPLKYLRRNISIIPQDPILFTGTVRENLDPHKKYADYALWNIIDRVGIRSIIPSLEHAVEDSGSSYSSGQKQLICLARAAIAKCKILILDEATANIDAVTEKLLHKVIDEIFYECTIVMIAHKLHLVMNCDKVLVMDNGNIVEFDDPRNLLNKEDSFFHKMCRKEN